jgi:hypothetical protein
MLAGKHAILLGIAFRLDSFLDLERKVVRSF